MSEPLQAFRAAVLAALCYAPEVIVPGRLQRFATRDRRGDDAGWCLMFEDLRGGVFGCNRSGVRENWTAVSRSAMTTEDRRRFDENLKRARVERERVERERWDDNRKRIEKTLGECVKLSPGDPVTLYLKRRGFVGVWPLPAVLMLHPRMPYWHGGENLGMFPAMVAPLVSPAGDVVALHRTYLTADGRKADVPKVKKLTGTAGPTDGACIRLCEPQEGRLGVGEGVETCLAAWVATGLPVVAAYSAGSLTRYQWPRDVRRLVVLADNDESGLGSAEVLRERAAAAGLSCVVAAPSDPGADWCDVYSAQGVAA